MNNSNDNRGETAVEQAVDGRDKRGRFAPGNTPTTGFHTNPERRSDGSWKKEDTARYKLEQMMTLTNDKLSSLIENDNTPLFERKLAQAIVDGSWPVLRDMMNEVYGKPKESIELSSQTQDPFIIRGFVLPVAPEDFIDKDIIEQLGEEQAAEVLDRHNR